MEKKLYELQKKLKEIEKIIKIYDDLRLEDYEIDSFISGYKYGFDTDKDQKVFRHIGRWGKVVLARKIKHILEQK